MKKTLALAAALVAAPFAASAGAPSYTYVEAGYASIEQDMPVLWGGNLTILQPEDVKASGFFIGGSFAVSDAFYLLGDYRRATDTIDVAMISRFEGIAIGSYSADVETSKLDMGFGYRYGVSDRTDVLAEAGARSTKVEVEDEFDRANFDNTDLRASVGVRSAPTDAFEVWAKASYTDGDWYESEFSGTLGMQYRFTPMWGVTAEYEGGSGFSQYAVGVRANF